MAKNVKNKRARDSSLSHGTYHYICAAAIIFFLVVINHVSMSLMIQAQQRHIIIGERGSAQRNLFRNAQFKIYVVSRQIKEQQLSPEQLAKVKLDFGEMANQASKLHAEILRTAQDAKLTLLPSVDVDKYYFEEPYLLDNAVKSVINSFNDFSNAENEEALLQMLMGVASSSLLASATVGNNIDELMQKLRASTEEQAKFLANALRMLNGLILVTLLLEGLFIFRPLIVRRHSYHEALIKSRKEFKRLAHQDPMTMLANRAYLSIYIEKLLKQNLYESLGKPMEFLFILLDLDGFKKINDVYGHNAGDEVLRTIAHRLRSLTRPEDFIARLGGDEFTIVFSEKLSPEDAQMLTQRIIDAINEPIIFEHKRFQVGASIGGAYYPQDACDLDSLLRYADLAMYKSKETGKNQFTLYSNVGIDGQGRKLAIDTALVENEFVVHFQPKIELLSNRHVGFEALIRWQHPSSGLVPPAKFIPFAEETGQISDITCYVYKAVKTKIQLWKSEDLDVGRVAINIPESLIALDLAESDFWKMVFSDNNAGDWLDIEITENVFLNDKYQLISQNLAKIREQNIGVYLDDFGTGYASLSHLKDMPITGLKIDRSFISDLHSDPKAELITRAVIELGNSLRTEVVAEGIETSQQRALLCELRCSSGQGYLFSKPMSPEDTHVYLEKNRLLKSAHVVTLG